MSANEERDARFAEDHRRLVEESAVHPGLRKTVESRPHLHCVTWNGVAISQHETREDAQAHMATLIERRTSDVRKAFAANPNHPAVQAEGAFDAHVGTFDVKDA